MGERCREYGETRSGSAGGKSHDGSLPRSGGLEARPQGSGREWKGAAVKGSRFREVGSRKGKTIWGSSSRARTFSGGQTWHISAFAASLAFASIRLW